MIYTGDNLINTIKKVTTEFSSAVKSTLGPEGSNVGINMVTGSPIMVNDGVAVAKSIFYSDELEQYICDHLRTAPQRTDEIGGDSTTTSVVLTEAILMEGLKYLQAGYSRVDLCKGIEAATKATLELLKLQRIQADSPETLAHLATISANNDAELGGMVAEIYHKIGSHAAIEYLPTENTKSTYEIVDGNRYNSGYQSGAFVNAPNNYFKADKVSVLLYEGEINRTTDLPSLLRSVENISEPLLIVADGYDDAALQHLAQVSSQTHLKLCCVRFPGDGELKLQFTEDLELLTGATLINEVNGNNDLAYFELGNLGMLKNVRINKEHMTFVSDVDITEQKQKIQWQIDQASKYDKGELEDRLAKLLGGVALINIGGSSPAEITERMYRAEDTIKATKCAMESGVLLGSGSSLYNASTMLFTDSNNESYQMGYKVLKKALKAPLEVLCDNANLNFDFAMNNTKDQEGVNIKNGQVGNLLEMGIVDPYTSIVAALESASSLAQQILKLRYVSI